MKKLVALAVLLSSLALGAQDRPTFPKKVKVGPFTYSLRYATAKEAEGGGWNGMVNPDALEIEIRQDLPLAREREVVLHELIHASVDVAYRGKLDCLSDEFWLSAQVPTLLETLRENPELQTYLLSR